MVLALVLIPTLLAPGQTIPGVTEGNPQDPVWQQISMTIFKVLIFVAIMLIIGKRALPWVLTMVSKTGSRELFTLAVFVAAIGIAFASSKLFGISFALGAFFSGMMIKESNLNHEVAERALPFQDAFAVLFFVSVGMLFNPAILIGKPFEVLIVTFIIMFGKSVAAFLIVIMFGYPLRTGLLVSSGLAQIGEFSFILVSLGIAMNALPDDGKDLILAGAIFSISLNPAMFKASRALYKYIDRHPKLRARFNMKPDRLAHMLSKEMDSLNDVVILVGHGRVGKYIRRHLQESSLDLVIIDDNRERVKDLRRRGFHAIAADAGEPEVLENAAALKACAIVIAVPDFFETQRIIAAVRQVNKQVKILARAHNDEEMEYFEENDVDLSVSGAQEIATKIALVVETIATQAHQKKLKEQSSS